MEFKQNRKQTKQMFKDLESDDWFNDPEWEKIKADKKTSRREKRPDPVYESSERQAIEVKINLAVPTKITRVIKKVSRRQVAYSLVGVAVLIGGAVFVQALLSKEAVYNPDVAGANTAATQAVLPREDPTFQLLYPGGKSKETIGEIVKISPPGNEPVYSYIDSVGGVKLNVSQQLIPEKFEGNVNSEMEKLAKDFQQNDTIIVDSVTVYHGQSQNGVQSLSFVKGNLLIIIRAAQPIEDEVWAAYISSLNT